MVDPHHIINIKAVFKTFQPPGKTGLFVIVPVIEWVAPELSHSAEAIRRAARRRGRSARAAVAPIAAALIQMAISRSREYSADEGGAEICGNPNYLAAALEKIEYYAVHGAPLPEATPETAHMCIINPFSGHDFSFKSLFSTHPATAERIARLREQAQRMHIR